MANLSAEEEAILLSFDIKLDVMSDNTSCVSFLLVNIKCVHMSVSMYMCVCVVSHIIPPAYPSYERWGAGVETQQNVRGEIGGWGRVPFNETYAPSLSTIYDGA